MSNWVTKVRYGSSNGFDLTNRQAIELLGQVKAFSRKSVTVTAVYATDSFYRVYRQHQGMVDKVHKAGEAVFGFSVEVHGRSEELVGANRLEIRPAQVNWSSHGSDTAENARYYAELLAKAANLAECANEEPATCRGGHFPIAEHGYMCPSCLAELTAEQAGEA